jgi:beta-1,4-N-acetylglucosaminyltransferase
LIFVTVGTNPTMHFDRLLKPIDALAAELEEPMVIQTGCSEYVPQHAEFFTFTTSVHMEELSHTARLIVSHAAAGSVITALRYRKPVVVVPRRCRLNEHIDDHQLELAKALDAESRAVVVYEPTVESLRQAIQLAMEKQGPADNSAESSPWHVGHTTPLMRALRTQLDAWHKDTLRTM